MSPGITNSQRKCIDILLVLKDRDSRAARYRHVMPLADPVLGKTMAITLFRASSLGAAG